MGTSSTQALSPNLTPKELQVLRELALGLEDKEVARKLGISPSTVQSHVEHMMAKLPVSTRFQLAVYAVATGLIDLRLIDFAA